MTSILDAPPGAVFGNPIVYTPHIADSSLLSESRPFPLQFSTQITVCDEFTERTASAVACFLIQLGRLSFNSVIRIQQKDVFVLADPSDHFYFGINPLDTPRRFPVRRLLAVLFVIFVLWRISVFFVGSKPVISPETTFVTGPLRPNGTIDYSAALHQRLSEGIKPDDNAVVLIDRAFGPKSISPELRSQYYQRLGIDRLPEQGDYVVTESAFIQQRTSAPDADPNLTEKLMKQFDLARRPWKQSDDPLVAEWIDANAHPLELLTEASKRSQFYAPRVTSTGLMNSESTIQNLRETARMLLTRAMLRLGNDDIDGAWNDLLACHRLAALAGQRPSSTIDMLVAVAIDAVAAEGDAQLMAHGLSSEQALRYLKEFQQLKPFGTFASVLSEGSRILALDAAFEITTVSFMDATTFLERINQLHEDLSKAAQKGDFSDRRKAYEAIENDLKSRIARAQKPVRRVANLIVNTRGSISRDVSDVLSQNLLPACTMADSALTRVEVRHGMIQIGFALCAMHADTGNYPATLEELTPKYLDTIPIDHFTGKSLIYRPNESGFIVYSLGANQKDENGVMDNKTKADDVALEVPQTIQAVRD